MIIFKKHISRRAVLRGLGATLALDFNKKFLIKKTE